MAKYQYRFLYNPFKGWFIRWAATPGVAEAQSWAEIIESRRDSFILVALGRGSPV